MPPENILQLAEEGRADEMIYNIRKSALSSLYYFTKVLCSYRELVHYFHMPLCNDIQNTINVRKRGYLWPRKHFKSTVIAKSYPHWRLCGGGLLESVPEILELQGADLLDFYWKNREVDPRNLRILITGESGDVAEKDLKDIKYRTENYDLFRRVFPELIPPDFRATKWTESEILLPRSMSFDEPTITCKGVGAKGTGFHYDMLIHDDIVGEAASHSEAIMNDALNWLKAAPGLLNDDAKGEELIAGTRWKHGEADVYGWLMKNMPYVPATEEGPATGFKFSTQSCYYEPTTEIRFKERFNTAIMEETRKRAGDYLFNCNYRNIPSNPEGSVLAGFKLYTVGPDNDGRMAVAHFNDGTPSVHINQLARVSFYDPSAGGSSAKCEGSISVVGTTSDNRHLLLSEYGENEGYVKAIESWHDLNDRFVCIRNMYEQVGHQKEVEDIILMRSIYASACPFCQKTHRLLAPQGIVPPSGLKKEERIELYLSPPIRDGRLYVRLEHAETIRQMQLFPHGDKVDRADSFAYAVKHSLPFQGIEEKMDIRDEMRQAGFKIEPYTNTKQPQYMGVA